MSHNSFIGSSHIILNSLDVLKDKFKEIYLLEYDSYKPEQIDACEQRDNLIKEKYLKEYDKSLEKIKDLSSSEKKILNPDINPQFYKPEELLNLEISKNINYIINKLELNNVHLIGKCNGAWICSLLLTNYSNYRNIYLSVPGIPLIDNILQKIESKIDEFKDMNLIIRWRNEDCYPFLWGESCKEIKRYESIINDKYTNLKDFKKLKLEICSDKGCEDKKDIKIYHEIDSKMVESILKNL
jgi:frataxin-like iron-binding protein CyaY